MQTAYASSAITRPQTNRLAYRFFWKECRRITGLAFGIGAIAIAVMLGLLFVGPVGSRPAQMMIVAFGGAAMLSIAAAITLFAVEKEERTADLLRALPRNHVGLLAGKWAAAVVSVLAFLAVLLMAAYAVAGGWPSGSTAALIVSQGVIVLAEALTLGVLASMVCPYPLAATVLGIALASLSSQLAVFLFVPSSHGYEVGGLQSALPARWAFVACAAAIDLWLGMRWLPVNAPGHDRGRVRISDQTATTEEPRRRWRALFFRLVWQSVRQSWGVALAAGAAGVCLSVSFALVVEMLTDSARSWRPIGLLGLLITPALLGAMVFRADQRLDQYRFLSEHAGRPNTVWAARILTWLTPTLFLVGVACFGAASYAANEIESGYQGYWLQYSPGIDVVDAADVIGIQLDREHARRNNTRAAVLVFSAALAAFAYGQFFSIILKSEILAAMLSVVSSVLIAAWTFVVWLGGLPLDWFLAPLGLGALLASWLRARDWLFERRGVTRFALPLAALVVPVGFALRALPEARSAQVPDLSSIPIGVSPRGYAEIVSQAERELERGRKAADAYQRLAGQIDDGEFGAPLSAGVFEELVRLSRVRCRLPATLVQSGEQSHIIQRLQSALLHRGPGEAGGGRESKRADKKPRPAAGEQSTDLDQRIAAILVCRRLAVQQSNGQSLTNSLHPTYLSEQLLDWATAEGQTAERILDAIGKLDAVERSHLGPSKRLANECLRIRAVIRGDSPPGFLSRRQSRRDAFLLLDEWLAFFANELPGESERAERSLAVLGAFWTRYLQGAEANLLSETVASTEASSAAWRQRVAYRHRTHAVSSVLAATARPRHRGFGLRQRAEVVRQAESSYLVKQEFASPWRIHRSVDESVSAAAWWRAERVRLALIASKLDNGSYPNTLEELSPDYIEPWQYRDAFSTGALGYAPTGLEHRTSEAWSYYPSRGTPVPAIPAGTPLLWSGGTGEAEPTIARVRYENENGSRVEILIEQGDADAETGESETVMELRPQPRTGGFGHFWMPLP